MKTLSFILTLILFLQTSSFAVDFPTGVKKERLAMELVWPKIKELPVGKRPRIVLVLGGGGARGLSHIGVLKILEQERIPIDEVVGVSVGALIGSLYAAGLPIEEIERMANEIGWNKLTDFSRLGVIRLILSQSLFSNHRMELYLDDHMGKKNFSDLKIPFTCLATDLRTGEPVIFREGPVALAARASATIPGVFKPVEYRQRFLVDGGLIDNLPIDLVSSRDENTIIIGVLPNAEKPVSDEFNVFKTMVRSIEIQKNSVLEESKKKANLMIEPNVGNMSITDLSKTKDSIESGMVAAREKAFELKTMILKGVK